MSDLGLNFSNSCYDEIFVEIAFLQYCFFSYFCNIVSINYRIDYQFIHSIISFKKRPKHIITKQENCHL